MQKRPWLWMVGCLFLWMSCTQADKGDDFIKALKASSAEVYLQDGSLAGEAVKVSEKWQGDFCQSVVTNNGKQPVHIREVVLFSVGKILPANTPFYGEGFQMLSQYTGTLDKVKDLGYSEEKHYKLPQPPGYHVVYNMLSLSPAGAENILLGFNSSKRFSGKFYISPDTIKVVMDIEGLELQPGQSFSLEEFSAFSGKDRNQLLEKFADRINHFHPRLEAPEPTGWCSWYCFGSHVTATDIFNNLDFIKQQVPSLKYIQLDDGYQPHMGDWLEVGKSFGGNVQEVLKTIHEKGFEPAIWVAPFICDSNSNLFKKHPDWLVKDEAGNPLRSDKVTFGGWRMAPWYVLDGTNPDVQQHLEQVFRVMHEKWGCTYFKLDANYWGAIQHGHFYDSTATRVEAYRRGMEAILKGAGNSFILGCNHPLWPSLGLIHGSRSSGDIKRSWSRFASTGRQNLYRAWQNGKLWWNDPDCVLLTGDLPDNEFMFHASLLYATGGMMLSGDDLTKIGPERLAVLRKLIPPTGKAADFDSTDFEIGRMQTGQGKRIVVLNWDDHPKTIAVPLAAPAEVVDYWTGKSLGHFENRFEVKDMAAHDGRVFIIQ